MQDRCLLICTVRSLNSFRYHSVVNSGVVLFSTDSWMGYIHSVADVYVVTRGESLFHTRYDEVSSRPLYWMRFFLTCISDLCSTSEEFFGLGSWRLLK